MDPRDRADETLARARARGAFVVTPDNATSPMDASTTVRIPRTVVTAADQAPAEADSTMAIPHPSARPQQRPEQRQQQSGQPQSGQQQSAQQQQQQAQQQTSQQQQQNDGYGWPAEDYGQQLPPNPYQAQRGAGQFGPLGSRAAQQNQQY